MWLYTVLGHYSVVRKPGDAEDGRITIRARVGDDLVHLRETFPAFDWEPISRSEHSDYEFRTRLPFEQWVQVAAGLAEAIDYPNFKSEVMARAGIERERAYEAVWLAGMQSLRKIAARR